jgi:ornithine cyclodeaminase/alanine dehydrogenase-like protein (mu-crystallin family)
VIVVALPTVTPVAATPPKLTVAPLTKFVPLIVTDVPPAVVPLFGERLLTVGAGLLVVESRVAFQPYPAGAHELQGLDAEAAVELGEVLAGVRPGRTSSDQITVYKSTGHAVEDAAAARLVYERARAEGAGLEVAL